MDVIWFSANKYYFVLMLSSACGIGKYLRILRSLRTESFLRVSLNFYSTSLLHNQVS